MERSRSKSPKRSSKSSSVSRITKEKFDRMRIEQMALDELRGLGFPTTFLEYNRLTNNEKIEALIHISYFIETYKTVNDELSEDYPSNLTKLVIRSMKNMVNDITGQIVFV